MTDRGDRMGGEMIRRCVLAAGMMLAVGSGVDRAAELMDVGQIDYEEKCAVCHGLDGKGKGGFAELLTVPMPDLTTLSARNGGVFPHQRVYRLIDGRDEVKAHGPREMPIWGQAYLTRAERAFFGYGINGEAFVRSRILALIDYLHRLQGR